MAQLAHHKDFTNFIPWPATPANAAAAKPGLWQRIFEAIYLSRQRHATREIERYLHKSGRVMTDDIERQMTQRFLTGDWR